MNFMALTVIAEFDDYAYYSQGKGLIKDITTNEKFEYLYKIKTTTSKDAQEEREEYLLVDDGIDKDDVQYKYIFVSFVG
jgi:predicted AAA+ superfamily ATPase